MTRGIAFVVAALFALAGIALAQPPGDPAAGGALFSEKCIGCHGTNGMSTTPSFPRLGGQVPGFLFPQLFILREGIRQSEIMNPIAAGLSDQDIADLVAFLSSQTADAPAWPDQDPSLVEQGQMLYEMGNYESGVIACSVCHGAAGQGDVDLGIPRIGGQSPGYLPNILNVFANLPDVGDAHANAMSLNTSKLSEDELTALVAYLASLPWGGE